MLYDIDILLRMVNESQIFKNFVSIFFVMLTHMTHFLIFKACDDQTTRMVEEDTLPCAEKGNWQIMDKSSADQFYHTLRTSSIRPASVTITGSNWEEADLLKLLAEVATVRCKVNLKQDDVFKKSLETSHQWITSVVSGNHK